MKKNYEKPRLVCEDLLPEEMLCGCEARNPTHSEFEMCGYTIRIPTSPYPITLFGSNWSKCSPGGEQFAELYEYCYHSGANQIFSS